MNVPRKLGITPEWEYEWKVADLVAPVRQRALELAIDTSRVTASAGRDTSSKAVLADAKNYLAFMLGKKP